MHALGMQTASRAAPPARTNNATMTDTQDRKTAQKPYSKMANYYGESKLLRQCFYYGRVLWEKRVFANANFRPAEKGPKTQRNAHKRRENAKSGNYTPFFAPCFCGSPIRYFSTDLETIRLRFYTSFCGFKIFGDCFLLSL